MSTATSRVFNKLNQFYDELDDVLNDSSIKDDLLELNYSESESAVLMLDIATVMNDLDNILPGIQMAYQEENKNK